MMLALLRRDDALRRWPLSAVPLLLNASVLLGLAASVAARQRSPVSPLILLVVGWVTIAIFLVAGPGRSRCRPFDLGLPISARRLWMSHLGAMSLGVLALVGAYVSEVALMRRVLGPAVVFHTDLSTLGLELAVTALLAVVLLQCVRPSLARVPLTLGHGAWTGVVVVGLLAILTLLEKAEPWGAFAVLAAALGVAVVAHRSVPAAFTLSARPPRTTGVDRGPVPTAASRRGSPTLALVRSVTTGPKELLSAVLTIVVGLFIGGATAAWNIEAGMRDMRFFYMPVASYLLFTLVVARLALLCHLDPLPLSRKRIFAGIVLPTAVAFVASSGIGAALARQLDSRTEYVDFCRRGEEERWCFSVPLRVYRIAWSGRAPEIGSPWGESHPAETMPLVRGAVPVLWNPFSAPPGSSARFVALQISRAAEAVYGVPIAPGEIELRWIEPTADGTIVGRGDHLPLRAENARLAPVSGPVFPMMQALVLGPWLLLVAVLLRTFRAGIPDRVPHLTFWGVVILFIASMVGSSALLVSRAARPWLPRALVEIPAWWLGESATRIAATWVVCASIVWASYRVARRQFSRMEIPSRPLRFSLFGRPGEDEP